MSSREPLRLHLLISFHQPLSVGHGAMAQTLRDSYLPLLQTLEQADASKVRVALHFGGHVLDHLARHDEETLLRLKEMRRQGRIEILSGLFYGGITGHLPEQDIRGQIEMAREFWESSLGETPSGFWLSALAWSAELPRLFADTGLKYGFVSDTQLHRLPGHAAVAQSMAALGQVERAGHAVSAFVLSSALSAQLEHLGQKDAEAWVQQALAAAEGRAQRAVSVWLRAEALVGDPGPLRHLLQALSRRDDVRLHHPADSFVALRPAPAPLRLHSIVAPELRLPDAAPAVLQFADFPYLYAEIDILHRRMMRISDKLHAAIALMEDEELEDSWSDKLATAQRLVFGAQSPDAYWRGLDPGFSLPQVRDETMARLLRAESLLDTLMQGEAPWIAAESHDLDGDLADEVFVATPQLQAWVAPQRGGQIYTLDDRHNARNLFDVGSRRDEPFFAAMRATLGPQAAAELPTAADQEARRGMRHFLGAANTQPEAFFRGTAANALQARWPWKVDTCGIDEDGDCHFRLALQAEVNLDGQGRVQVKGHLSIPGDGASLQVHAELLAPPNVSGIYAVEVPLRLGSDALELSVDGRRVSVGAAAALPACKLIKAVDGSGRGVELHFEGVTEVWCTAIVTTLSERSGYRACAQGLVLAPWVKLGQTTRLNFELRLI